MSHNTTKFGSAKLKRSSHGGSFTDLAELYSEVSDIQKEHGKELIDELSIAKNMKILDLGCGTGYHGLLPGTDRCLAP